MIMQEYLKKIYRHRKGSHATWILESEEGGGKSIIPNGYQTLEKVIPRGINESWAQRGHTQGMRNELRGCPDFE